MKEELNKRTTKLDVTIQLLASLFLISVFFSLALDYKNFDFTPISFSHQQDDLKKNWNDNLLKLDEVEIIDICISFSGHEDEINKIKTDQHTNSSFLYKKKHLFSIFLDITFPPPRNLNFA